VWNPGRGSRGGIEGDPERAERKEGLAGCEELGVGAYRRPSWGRAVQCGAPAAVCGSRRDPTFDRALSSQLASAPSWQSYPLHYSPRSRPRLPVAGASRRANHPAPLQPAQRRQFKAIAPLLFYSFLFFPAASAGRISKMGGVIRGCLVCDSKKTGYDLTSDGDRKWKEETSVRGRKDPQTT